MFEAGDTIVVGVSGGADSVCLLFLLDVIRSRYDLSLRAVHVHHGLRKAADDDVSYTEELCRYLDIPCRVVRVNAAEEAKRTGCGIEEAGRALRYRAFEEEADSCGGKIAVAHHMEDQAETVLFHLCRGTGMNGLKGMLPVSGRIIRPILPLSRPEIEEILTDAGISWREDESNDEDMYARNRIRHRILPLMEKEINSASAVHLYQLSVDAAMTEDYMAGQTAEAAGRCVTKDGDILTDRLLSEHPAIQRRILLDVLSAHAGRRKDISRVHAEALLELCGGEGSGECSLPYGITAVRIYNRITFRKNTGKIPDTGIGTLPMHAQDYEIRVLPVQETAPCEASEPYTKYFDYDKITEYPVLRTRQKGDRITIHFGGHTKSLSREMIDLKIPKELRDRIILPAFGNEILWIPGMRTNAAYPVTESTKTVLAIRYLGNTPDGEKDSYTEEVGNG